MKIFRYLILILGICWVGQVQAATTLLPNGKQCFEGVNGAYSSGSINMFVPNTTTPKSTWQDFGTGLFKYPANPIRRQWVRCNLWDRSVPPATL